MPLCCSQVVYIFCTHVLANWFNFNSFKPFQKKKSDSEKIKIHSLNLNQLKITDCQSNLTDWRRKKSITDNQLKSTDWINPVEVTDVSVVLGETRICATYKLIGRYFSAVFEITKSKSFKGRWYFTIRSI